MAPAFVRDTWPLRRRDVGVLALVYIAFTAVWTGIGLLLTGPLNDSFIVRTDRSVAEWLADHRTPRLDSLSHVGSALSDTIVKIVVTAIVAGAMLAVWKRWFEALVVSGSLVLEALSFITITTIVGRDRPPVQIDSSPIGSSYPSGHVAAAVAYSAIVVVVFWRSRNLWVRVTAVTCAFLVSVSVALSRMYRGMHFFTDVVFGALLGGASVAAVVVVLRRAADEQGIEPPR